MDGLSNNLHALLRSLKASTHKLKYFPPVVDDVSEKTLSSCSTAAYLSWVLEPPTGGGVWPTPPGCCCWCCWDRDWGRGCVWGWFRPPKSTLRDLGKALKGPVVPEADIVRPESEKTRLGFSARAAGESSSCVIHNLELLNLKGRHQLIYNYLFRFKQYIKKVRPVVIIKFYYEHRQNPSADEGHDQKFQDSH